MLHRKGARIQKPTERVLRQTLPCCCSMLDARALTYSHTLCCPLLKLPACTCLAQAVPATVRSQADQ